MKLKVPDTISVFGIEQAVKIDKLDEDNDCGEYNYKLKQIRISEDVAEQGRADLLFHEVLELINMVFELGLTHRQICAISVGYYDFIANNIDRMIDTDKGD